MVEDNFMASQATLEAMGLTLYRARYPLPGAAASPLWFTASDTVDEQPQQQPEQQRAARHPAQDPLPTRSAAWVAPLSPEPDAGVRPVPARQRAAEPRTVPAASALAPFTLAAVALGGCLWLEELPDGVLGRDQVQLMRAICRALGWPADPVGVNQFTWPMHRNPQFDQGAEAALAALSAFVQRQMNAGDCERLILLGQPARDRLGQLPPGTPVLATCATRDMLRDPLLKRDAWRDLRPR